MLEKARSTVSWGWMGGAMVCDNVHIEQIYDDEYGIR